MKIKNKKYKLIFLIIASSCNFLFCQTENVLNNSGNNCTVIMGGENITVNNNIEYLFPENKLDAVFDTLIVFFGKKNLLDNKKRKIQEREINVNRKVKEVEKRILQYEHQLNLINEMILQLDSDNTISNKELEEITQYIKLGVSIIKNMRCLFEDYEFEQITDKNGKIIHRIKRDKIEGDPNYIFVYPNINGFSKIKQYNKYGFIDGQGNICVPPKYDYAFDFSEGRALVGVKTFNRDIYYFINSKNKKLSIDLLNAKSFKNGIAWARKVIKTNNRNRQMDVLFNLNFC